MSFYAHKIALALGVSELDPLETLWGGLLHDVGMAAVPTAIIGKSGALDAAEIALVRGHVTSHDLKSPLAALIGRAARLARDPGAHDAREVGTELARILDAGERMASFVSDILDMARVEAGRITLVRRLLRVPALLSACIDSLDLGRHALVRRGDAATLIRADAARLEQVFSNLLANAAKYAPEGSDEDLLTMLADMLRAARYEVRSATSAHAGLERAAERAPELVISDIVMPEMGGFELRRAYEERFPRRDTPWVFLSSLGDTSTIVEGLDLGADDYLTKPVAREILLARVRAILRRNARHTPAVFTGSLAKLNVGSILRFCESKGLTGEVSITSGSLRSRFPFRAGELVTAGADGVLEQLWDLTEGEFVIASRPVDFAEIEDATAAGTARRDAGPPPPPAGCLSGVRLAGRLFQVQTEVVRQPSPCIVTIVTLDGRTMQKRTGELPPGGERTQVERAVHEQHIAVERDIERRVSGAASVRAGAPAETPREHFNRLFDEGFERFQSGDFAAAQRVWSEAQSLDPDNASIRINLQVLERMLAQKGGA